MASPGIKPSPKLVPPGHSKEKVGKETPAYASIMVNLETSLVTTVDKSCGNTSGAIVERFIKLRASTMFGNPVYFLDWPGPSILVSGPHEGF